MQKKGHQCKTERYIPPQSLACNADAIFSFLLDLEQIWNFCIANLLKRTEY